MNAVSSNCSVLQKITERSRPQFKLLLSLLNLLCKTQFHGVLSVHVVPGLPNKDPRTVGTPPCMKTLWICILFHYSMLFGVCRWFTKQTCWRRSLRASCVDTLPRFSAT